MFANLDYYASATVAFLCGLFATFCGIAALYGWGMVLFSSPDFWQSVQIHGWHWFSGYLSIAVYACPVLAAFFGWLALRWFR